MINRDVFLLPWLIRKPPQIIYFARRLFVTASVNAEVVIFLPASEVQKKGHGKLFFVVPRPRVRKTKSGLTVSIPVKTPGLE